MRLDIQTSGRPDFWMPGRWDIQRSARLALSVRKYVRTYVHTYVRAAAAVQVEDGAGGAAQFTF